MRSTESRAARICHPQRQAGCLATFVRNKSTNIFVYVVVVKIIALIVKHSLRYLWMQEAGGLATHDILRVAFHGYLACHNKLAAEAPLATRGTPGNHPITTLWPPVTLKR
jgi:hypothetical protein